MLFQFCEQRGSSIACHPDPPKDGEGPPKLFGKRTRAATIKDHGEGPSARCASFGMTDDGSAAQSIPGLTKACQAPEDLPVAGDFEHRDTRRRALVGAGHAAGIEEEHVPLPFMARHVGVAVEENIDVLRRVFWRNVHEPETDAVALQVEHRWPLKIGITIAAHERDRRPDAFHPNEQTGRTNVAQMPDFIHIIRQGLEIVREMIMRVGQDEDSQ